MAVTLETVNALHTAIKEADTKYSNLGKLFNAYTDKFQELGVKINLSDLSLSLCIANEFCGENSLSITVDKFCTIGDEVWQGILNNIGVSGTKENGAEHVSLPRVQRERLIIDLLMLSLSTLNEYKFNNLQFSIDSTKIVYEQVKKERTLLPIAKVSEDKDEHELGKYYNILIENLKILCGTNADDFDSRTLKLCTYWYNCFVKLFSTKKFEPTYVSVVSPKEVAAEAKVELKTAITGEEELGYLSMALLIDTSSKSIPSKQLAKDMITGKEDLVRQQTAKVIVSLGMRAILKSMETYFSLTKTRLIRAYRENNIKTISLCGLLPLEDCYKCKHWASIQDYFKFSSADIPTDEDINNFLKVLKTMYLKVTK